MAEPYPLADWPPDATVLGWYAGGCPENPWHAACLWLSVPNPDQPDDDPHLTIRPAWMAPPGVVEWVVGGGTVDDDEPAETGPLPPLHPGTALREALAARGWTQGDLATIVGRPVAAINRVVCGKRGISPRMAYDLAAALDGPPEYWLHLWTAYRLWCVRTGHPLWEPMPYQHSREREE